jgi:hypothetical protein
MNDFFSALVLFVLFFYVGGSIAVAVAVRERGGSSPFAWFLLSVLFSPIFAVLLLIVYIIPGESRRSDKGLSVSA